MCVAEIDAPRECVCVYVCVCVCVCVCEQEQRVRGYLQTETNQCVWDKKAAFMVYGNQPPLGLPPPCIITTTYSHDWWNMRLWNPSCFCYHPVPPPPHVSFLFLATFFFCLVQPLCLSKYLLSPLQWPEMFGTVYKQEITHTAWGPLLKKLCTCTHAYTLSTHTFLSKGSNMMHEKSNNRMKRNTKKGRGGKKERKRKEEERASKRGDTLIVLSCREKCWLD